MKINSEPDLFWSQEADIFLDDVDTFLTVVSIHPKGPKGTQKDTKRTQKELKTDFYIYDKSRSLIVKKMTNIEVGGSVQFSWFFLLWIRSTP